jgi:hypothetical protein
MTQLKAMTRAGRRQNRVVAASAPITIRHQQRLRHARQTHIIIDVPPQRPQKQTQTNTLSAYLDKGRQMHPLCRHSFIERVELGYYHYERRIEWRTCALAAAYAGAFGAYTVERPDFSYSMAIWQLSQKLGYDLRQTIVYGPTGRCQPIIDEMVQLIDQDEWTRKGVVEWLRSLNL